MSLRDKQTSQLLKYYQLLGFTADHEISTLVDVAADYEDQHEELVSLFPYLKQEEHFYKLCDDLAKLHQKHYEECRLPSPKHREKFYEKKKMIVKIMLKRYNTQAYTENLNYWSVLTNLSSFQAKRIAQQVNLPIEELTNELNTLVEQKQNLLSLQRKYHEKKQNLENSLLVTNDNIARLIRDKYKQMALKSHPDRSGNPFIFKAVAQAYKVLTDEKLRKLYNKTANHKLFKEIYTTKDNFRSELRKFAPGTQMTLTYESTEIVTGVHVSLVSVARKKSPSGAFDTIRLDKIPESITPENKRVNVFIGWLPILAQSLLHYEVRLNIEDQLHECHPVRSIGCILKGLQRFIRYTVEVSWINWQVNHASVPFTFVIDEQYKPVPLYGKVMSKLSQKYNLEMKTHSKKNSKKKSKKNSQKEKKETGNNKILTDFKKVKSLLTKNTSLEKLAQIFKEYSESSSLQSLLSFSVYHDNLLFFCCKNSKISLENFAFFLEEGNKDLPWNLQHPVDKKTALINLIFLSDVEKLRKFIEIGKEMIEVNIQCELGYSVVHYCVLNNEIESLKLLHSSFAEKLDLNLLDFAEKFSKTPLHLATERGNLEMVSFLLEIGALLHFPHEDYPEADISPLFTSLQLNQTPIVWKFIDFIQAHHESRELIDTITHLAVIKDDLVLFKKLVELGANVNLQNEDGDTCLHLAFELDAPHFINYLVSLPGIDVNIRNNSDFLPEELVAVTVDDVEQLLESASSLNNSSETDLSSSSHSLIESDSNLVADADFENEEKEKEEVETGQSLQASPNGKTQSRLSDMERILAVLSNPALSFLNPLAKDFDPNSYGQSLLNPQSVTQTSMLLMLPFEIFVQIMFYLSPFDWISLSEVCRRAYVLANQQYLWHKAYLKQENKYLTISFSVGQDWKLLFIRNYFLQLIEDKVKNGT